MTSLNNKYTNNRSMNGLLNIFAHNIETDNSVVNNSLIVDGENISDIIDQVENNSFKLTDMNYIPLPIPTTIFYNNIDCGNSLIIRDVVDPSIYMKIFYNDSDYGFNFASETQDRYMNFLVKDLSNNILNVFRIHHIKIISLIPHEFISNIIANGTNISPVVLSFLNGVTSNIQNQINSKFNTSGGTISGNLAVSGTLQVTNNSTFGATVFTGQAILNENIILNKDIVLSSVNARLTLFGGVILTQTELSRLDGVTSNIQTQINSLVINQNNFLAKSGGIMTGNLTLNQNIILNKDIVFNNIDSKINLFDGTIISQTDLLYLDGATSNIQTQINSLSGSLIQFLPLAGGTMTGDLTLNENIILNKNIVFNNINSRINLFSGTLISQTELSHLDGVYANIQMQINSVIADLTQFLPLAGGNMTGNLIQSGSSIINQTGTGTNVFKTTNFNGNISLTNTTSTQNRIIQSIITGDLLDQQNTLKYTTIAYNSNAAGGTAQRLLTLIDNFNNNALWFFPNLSPGAYNSIVSTGSRGVISGFPQNNNSLVLSCWGSIMNGIRIFTTGASHAQTEIRAGASSSIILNNTTGVTITTTANIGYMDGSVQTTAYTSAKDTKLINIGTITTAVLVASALLVSGVAFNCGSIILSAGTYVLTLNCGFIIVSGNTTIDSYTMTHSTSPTTITTNTNLNINNCEEKSWSPGRQWVVPNTAIVTVTTPTMYFMLLNVVFNIANRVQFANGLSSFSAIRIA